MFAYKQIGLVVFVCCALAVTVTHQSDQASAAPNLVVKLAATPSRACPDVVKLALQAVDKGCGNTSRNTACYGNIKVEVEPQAGAPKFSFEKPGDKVLLKNIHALRLDSLNSSDWGIALLKLQANLADTAPGQNVTMLLFGNVQITDSSKTAIHPTDLPPVVVTPPPLSALPTSAATGVTNPSATPRVTPRPSATPKPSATPSPTPTVSSAYQTMQAFYFSSGVGEPTCKEAPQDGILIQSPQGSQQIDLLIDEARIVIGSTVFLQAQAGGYLTINTLEGSAAVSAFGQMALADAGSRVRVPLDANLKASGPPIQAEPYALNIMQPLPAQHLPQKVTPAPPIATLPPGYAASTWRVVFSAGGVSGQSCASPGGTYFFAIATNADGSGLRWGSVAGSGSGGSYDVTYTPGAPEPPVYHFHFTSPTHGEGTYSYISPDCPAVVGAFRMDLVGGPALGAGSVTPAATAAS